MSSRQNSKNTRTTTTPTKTDEIESRFIDTVSRLSLSMGLNRIVGQIYALLYLRGKPLSLDEISEALKVSKGNISVNIRELENWGAVKTVWVPGSRKDYYEANMDVIGVIYKRVRLRLERTVSEISENLSEWETVVKNSDLSEMEGRLKEIREIKNALDAIVKILPSEMSSAQLIKKMTLISKLKSIL